MVPITMPAMAPFSSSFVGLGVGEENDAEEETAETEGLREDGLLVAGIVGILDGEGVVGTLDGFGEVGALDGGYIGGSWCGLHYGGEIRDNRLNGLGVGSQEALVVSQHLAIQGEIGRGA